MKIRTLVLIYAFIASMAFAYELHPDGYSVGINEPEKKKGNAVEIKIGFAQRYDPRFDINPKKIESTKDGFVIYECWAARNADEEKITECDVVIRHIFVPTKKVKEFEKIHCYVRPELINRNPFPGANVLDIKEDGKNLKGTLWMVEDLWVVVTK